MKDKKATAKCDHSGCREKMRPPLTYPALPAVCRDVTGAAGVCERALVPPVKARQWSTVTVTRLVSQG